MIKKSHLFAVGALIALSPAGSMVAAEEMSDEAAQKLERFEQTGETRSCLGLRRISQITPLDDHLFLVRVGANEYYLNEVNGRCSGASRSFNRLQYKTSIGQLCRNEIIRVVDNSSGISVGSCGLGSFERLQEKTENDTE